MKADAAAALQAGREDVKDSYFLAMVDTRILLWVLECWYWVTNWITPRPPWGIGALCCSEKTNRTTQQTVRGRLLLHQLCHCAGEQASLSPGRDEEPRLPTQQTKSSSQPATCLFHLITEPPPGHCGASSNPFLSPSASLEVLYLLRLHFTLVLPLKLWGYGGFWFFHPGSRGLRVVFACVSMFSYILLTHLKYRASADTQKWVRLNFLFCTDFFIWIFLQTLPFCK